MRYAGHMGCKEQKIMHMGSKGMRRRDHILNLGGDGENITVYLKVDGKV